MSRFFIFFVQSGDEMEPLFKEELREGSRNVTAIPEKLTTQFFDRRGNRCPIINIAWSQTTRQQFTLIIDRQVQLQPKEPAHACLALPGVSCKDPMLVDPLRITDAPSDVEPIAM